MEPENKAASPPGRLRPLDALNALSGKDNPPLIAIAFEIARSFPDGVLQKVFSATTDRFYSPHSLLAIIAYHYAVGCFGSNEIARRLAGGRPASWPDAERPDGNSIRRFRNRNRLCVQQALERCLLRFCENACPAGDASTPHVLRVIKAEARMRIHQAELADLESEF